MMMIPKVLLSIVLGIGLAGLSVVAVAGGEPAATKQDRHTSKPSASVDLAWLQDGREGVVEIEVFAGTAHDGVELMLITGGPSGPDSQATRVLPSGPAGLAGTVTWTLPEPLRSPPRVLAVLRQGEARQARSFVAPSRLDQDVVGPQGAGDETGQGTQPNASQSQSQITNKSGRFSPADAGSGAAPGADPPLDEMPAQEILKRGQPVQPGQDPQGD